MTATAQRVERNYGFGINGCVTSLDRHEVPVDKMAGESRDLLVRPPFEEDLGKAVRRRGAAGIGAATGVLEMPIADATMRGIHAFEFPTTVSSDGYPVLGILWADESKRFGQMYLRDGADYTEGEEFGAFHYTAGTAMNIVAPPIPYDGNGATGYMRYAYEENRRRTVAGSRNRVGIKNREYFGGFQSAATNCARGYNLSSASGTNKLIRYPTGLIMPLRESTHDAANYPAPTAAGPWAMGDQYYEAWGFEYDDGTRSLPFIPREPTPALPAGLGLVTVNDTGAAQFYAYVPDRNIRIGPPGVTKRLKYRSNKITKAEAAAGKRPDVSTLKLCAIIEDNTSTSYDDARGNDVALVTDSLLRIDQIWQPRARYQWTFDQRQACGYVRPCPYAIVVAPTGDVAAIGDINSPADAGWPSATAYMVQVRLTSAGVRSVRVRRTAGGAPTETVFLTAGITLQTLVDLINITTTAGFVAGTSPEWRAQLVPGAGGQVPADNLAPTHIDAAGGTWTNGSTTLNVTNATDLAEGMKVNDPKWPANTYIKSKAGNVLTMSAQSTAAQAVAADVEFYCDTGDDGFFADAAAHSQKGNARTIGNSCPFIIAFKQSYLDTFPTEKRDFLATAGGPTQKPNGARLFHTSPGGRFSGESGAGILMGGAPLHSGAIVFYSKWIGWYHNVKSGSTGEDAEYRMDWIVQDFGCESPYSIVYGDGWAGCWTGRGYWIFDGEKSSFISLDHFRLTSEGTVGDFAYEAGLCKAAAAADSNDYYFEASYEEGRLWLSLRVSAGVGATYCYDASASQEGHGIYQMLKPDGTTYGWSSKLRYSWRSAGAGCLGAITGVRKSDGVHLYQSDDANDKTNCGLVQEFQTIAAYTDGADPVTWQLWFRCDLIGGLKKHSLHAPIVLMLKNTVSSGATGVSATIYRNQARTAGTGIVIPLSDTIFGRKPIPPGFKAASAGEVTEIMLAGGSLTAERVFELVGIQVPADILESVT